MIKLGREPELLVSRVPNLTPHEKSFVFIIKLAPRPTFTYLISKTTVYNSRLMSALAQLSRFLDRINTYIGYLCGFFAFSMVIIVFTVVVLRYGFSIGFIWMQEIYVWLHSFIFMLGSGFTYLANEHVRIDVFYRDASEKYKATVDLLGNIFLLIPFLYIIWKFSYPFVYRSFLMSEVSREAGGMPALYILKSAILWFCIVLFIQIISNICKSIISLSGSKT